MLKKLARKILYDVLNIEINRTKGLIRIHTDPSGIDVLHDAEFRRSVDTVRPYTYLDTARLANLWQLCRLSNPQGNMLEAGVFRGGSSLHLHNCAPSRKIFLCDTFEGFGKLRIDDDLDGRFKPHPDVDPSDNGFANTSPELVRDLMSRRTSNFRMIIGCFPGSDVNNDVDNLSFAHIDFDLYASIVETLEYLDSRFIDKSVIVIDDYLRTSEGVVKAVAEFLETSRHWAAIPVYPGQGVLLHKSWFG
jgi:hypothetical protein